MNCPKCNAKMIAAYDSIYAYSHPHTTIRCIFDGVWPVWVLEWISERAAIDEDLRHDRDDAYAARDKARQAANRWKQAATVYRARFLNERAALGERGQPREQAPR